MVSQIRGFHDGDYGECRLLGHKNQVPTSQETHYFSATEPSLLIVSHIRGFHDGDYEECRLLGYKNQVRTSQPHSLTWLVECAVTCLWGWSGTESTITTAIY
jgi:hypothetical protein